MTSNRIWISIGLVLCAFVAKPQEPDSATAPRWNHDLEASFYLLKDDFIFLPAYHADKGRLHLEGRFNYEDINTFSAWIGYNFSGGKTFQYVITPMAGGVAGRLNGIAAGLELTLNFKGFVLYSESEHVFDLKEKENDFFYNWTDLTFAPTDWLFFGLSGQRTRLYQSALDIQRGFLVGGSYRRVEITGYLYNPGFDDLFVLLTLGVDLSK